MDLHWDLFVCTVLHIRRRELQHRDHYDDILYTKNVTGTFHVVANTNEIIFGNERKSLRSLS